MLNNSTPRLDPVSAFGCLVAGNVAKRLNTQLRTLPGKS